MGETISEKIIGEHAGKKVSAGEIVIADVDVAYVQDGTGPLTVRQMEEMRLEKAHNPEKTVIFLDHASPSPRLELSNDHKMLREFAQRTGVRLSEVGNGISHQVVTEDYANPGDIIIGADSHTCTNGALGAFATGMGSSDVAVAIALGKVWLRVPKTLKILVRGEFSKGVYAKDLILHIIGDITCEGATYEALEFVGEAIENMGIAGRLTISNMAVESGAKVGLIPPDEITRRHLEQMGRGDRFREIGSDDDAQFEKTLEYDVSNLAPTISCPHQIDNIKTVDEIEGTPVDQVFMGTSTNGRLEDFHVAARIIKGKKVPAGTRLIVTPASRRIHLEGMKDGTFLTLIEAGAVVTGPGCGACVGVHEGVLADGEVCVSTQNRNFKGRMGNPNASIYLVSPAVAAATAVEGKIADPRDML